MIFLNEEKFIEAAIQSVLAQGYTSWELLLVDDGSSDESTVIARRYADSSPEKVRYLEHSGHDNRGMSASRNVGIHRARGQYIAFLDADDVWVPRTLEEQVAILELQPTAAMVYGRIQRWYSWTGDPKDRERDSLRELVVPPDTLVAPPTLAVLVLQDRGVPSGFIVRREVIDRVGGFEKTFRGMYEDNAFLLKICLRHPVFASSHCWYQYRKRSDSSCAVTVQAGRYRAARRAFLSWAEQYLSQQGITDRDVWLALRDERRRERRNVVWELRWRVWHLLRRGTIR